ncbi:hypothetical protein [Mucilaginibacter auburnensis]|nr:hypothetical protein [Mucilaginibacter auburnensis]
MVKTVKMICFCVLALIATTLNAKTLPQKFDKGAFYEAMKSGDLDVIEKELEVVRASSTPNKDGYEGALLMRKAGLVKRPAEKLKHFKAGRIKFDTAIMADKDNTEYHFLRLAIQEHAPKIVKYNKDLEADKEFILKEYKNLPQVVQQAILDYTKNSKLLKAQDFS